MFLRFLDSVCLNNHVNMYLIISNIESKSSNFCYHMYAVKKLLSNLTDVNERINIYLFHQNMNDHLLILQCKMISEIIS